MSIAGDYKFHSILVFKGDSQTYVGPEEYLNGPVDSEDPEYVSQEKAERLAITQMFIRVSEDGTLKVLQPVPATVSKEELAEAIASGEVMEEDGFIYDKVQKWEERDGVAYYDTGMGGNLLDEPVDSWTKLLDEDGYISYMLMRFSK